MSPTPVVTIIVAVVLVVAVIGWFLAIRHHPEDAASHSDAPPSTTSQQLFRGVARPAGPDAEVMTPELLGGDLEPPEPTTRN